MGLVRRARSCSPEIGCWKLVVAVVAIFLNKLDGSTCPTPDGKISIQPIGQQWQSSFRGSDCGRHGLIPRTHRTRLSKFPFRTFTTENLCTLPCVAEALWRVFRRRQFVDIEQRATKSVDRKYCGDCGKLILRRAELCPAVAVASLQHHKRHHRSSD